MSTSSRGSSPLPWDFDVGLDDPADGGVGDGAKESQEGEPSSVGDDAKVKVEVAEEIDRGPVAVAARRAKAMSVGNAASLFGGPPSPVNELAAAAAATPAFESIGEEAEPPQEDSKPVPEPVTNDDEADAGDAANLFSSLAAAGSSGAGGADDVSQTAAASSGMDWLGGEAAQPAQNTQSFASNYQEQAPGYAGDAQQPQQYAYYDQQNAYAGQPNYANQSTYNYDTASGSLYADPSSQQAYQANLQAQAHSTQQPAQAEYNQSYNDMSASYYQGQQPQSAYQQSYPPQMQTQQGYQQTGGYDANSQYLGAAQQSTGYQQTPYTAPAGSAYGGQMAYSQAQGPSAGSSAPTYGYNQQSQSYDPYAPSTSDPYAASQPSAKPALAHSMTQPATSNAYDPYTPAQYASVAPTLQHSATSAAITTVGSQQAPPVKPKELNRSKSSFFAELPPMPAPKSRPPSSMSNVRGQGGAVPPMPSMSSAGTSPKIPPPPKSRTPAPSARPGSAASISRPGSRTAQRQGSLASSYGGRSSVDHSAQYAAYPATSAGPTYAASNGRSSARQSFDGNQRQYADPRSYATSPPPQMQQQQYQQIMYDAGPSYGQQYQSQVDPYSRMQSPPYMQPQANGFQPQSAQAYSPYAAADSVNRYQGGAPVGGEQYYPSVGQGQLQPQATTSQSQYNDYHRRVQSPPSQQAPAGPPPARRAATQATELSPRSTAPPLPSMASSPLAQIQTLPEQSPAAMSSFSERRSPDAAVDSLTAALHSSSIAESRPSRQRQETANSAVSIARTHEEVDELPVHVDLASAEDESSAEPYERSITLDAYLPPSPLTAERKEDPLAEVGAATSTLEPAAGAVPTLAVSSPSPALATANSDESMSTPLGERQADEELRRAERDLDRQLYAEDGAELDMLVEPQSGQTGIPTSSSYDNAYDPYGYSSQPARDATSQQQPLQQDFAALSGPQQQSQQSYDPYAFNDPYDPYATSAPNQPCHGQEGGSAQAAAPAASYDPYGSSASYGGGYSQSLHETAAPQAAYAADPYAAQNAFAPQERSQYDVSPVQPLTNGHSSAEATRPPLPAVSFGFNGRLVTFFPSASTSYGSAGASYSSPYGESACSSASASVTIRKISELLPTDAATLEAFPGPVFMDAGTTSASGKAKKKKDVTAWLDARIEEADKEASYISSVADDPRKRDAEEKGILLKLVKVMLENDGKLFGSVKIDEAVRAALLPHLTTAGPAASLPTAADLRTDAQSVGGAAAATDADLDSIQAHLLTGDKREAVRYALDRKLWAHALVIASGVDKELAAAVTREFVQAEVAGRESGGREPLKVAYSLLTGAGAQSIQEFLPARSLATQSTSSFGALGKEPYAPLSRSATPMPGAEQPRDISPAVLSRWRETVAMIIANSSDRQALTSLGDVLAANNWLKAAHACYLLSPQTSILGGPGMPAVRYSLLGAKPAQQIPESARDMEAIMLTEIVEFALSLVPNVKGQEPYIGLPYLQGYRTMHALELSDMGMHSAAQKYCDALGATLKLATKASPFYHPALLAQIKDLSDRLSLVSFQDKSGSWISRKVQRPTLDNVWSTLEGRFTKFVAGEVEEDPAEAARKRAKQDAAKAVAGPFAHYSSITPTGMESLSRNASSTDLAMRATPPPQPTSVPNTVTRTGNVKQTHHRRSSSYGYGPYGADPYPPYMNTMPDTVEEAETSLDDQPAQGANAKTHEPQYGYVTPQNDTGWWSSANGGQGESPYGSGFGQQPQMYSPVAEGGDYSNAEGGGLMSPMAYHQSSPMTASSSQTQYGGQTSSLATTSTMYDEADDDELGLGNNANKRAKEKLSASEPASSGGPKEDQPAPKKEEPTVRPAASSSWLGRIFRREGGSPQAGGPIRAKLGEETSFVYDPVEKRWVNKKAGADTPPPAPIVPPPRAQTASPSAAARGSFASQMSTPPAPVMRASTASPPIRSHSAAPPTPAASAAPPPPSGASSAAAPPPSRPSPSASGELPPPPKKPAGGAARKNVRNRYVDVFAQQQQGKS